MVRVVPRKTPRLRALSLSLSLYQRLCYDFRGFTRPAAFLARVIRLSSRDDDEIIAS